MVEEGWGIDEKGFANKWEEDNLKGEGIVRRAFLWNGKSLRFLGGGGSGRLVGGRTKMGTW